MSVLYADTSAIVRAYLPDEPEHAALRALILDGTEPVVTSEIAWVEFASAVRAAHRTGRLVRPDPLLARFEAHIGPGGPIALIPIESDVVLPAARRLVDEQELRTLDAIHLATALGQAAQALPGEEIVFVSRDIGQAAAARQLGLEVR